MKSGIRVRFAPSPTGIMHLGNVRTALLNYLFAQQKNGTFILRVEDTDPARNFDPGATRIINDLKWLGITYDEGPIVGGSYAPYLQSERGHIYQQQLEFLRNKNLIYRCFCTPEELEQKRERSIALKLPPRYDQACLSLTDEQIEKKLAETALFIWRFKVPNNESITINDLAHGPTTFELKNFSDFPLSRADGSFTFLFSNAVDDMLMNITHVLRGADHLSNTANQAVLFKAFDHEQPCFLHLPILCNVHGKKLSKRDFGFALENLQEGGFLPEAIINYLAIIGLSVKNEIMTMQELVAFMKFDNLKATGNIRYDLDKLRWVNHKWIERLEDDILIEKTMPFLETSYDVSNISRNTLIELLRVAKSEMITLRDVVPALYFYFFEPSLEPATLHDHLAPQYKEIIKTILENNIATLENPDHFIQEIQANVRTHNIATKVIFTVMRLALTGKAKGPSLVDIITILGAAKSRERLQKFLVDYLQ